MKSPFGYGNGPNQREMGRKAPRPGEEIDMLPRKWGFAEEKSNLRLARHSHQKVIHG
jgi:hypothetical protein